MVRWEPDSAGRLEQAAWSLFDEQGYEATTVADIAERAGLTKRTFFRHYADKREVLFGGSPVLRDLLVAALAGTSETLEPFDAVIEATAAAGAFFNDERRDYAAKRLRLVDAHTDLMERELVKLAALTDDLAAVLRDRGVEEPAASLSADAGITVFKHAFGRWTAAGGDFGTLVRATADELRAVTLRP